MGKLVYILPLAIAGCINAQPSSQDRAPPMPMAHAKPAATPPDLSAQGLAALDAMTFDCPRAGLNAAAREAAKIPSQGSYQFSYFRIINDAHHASYEVHFASNHLAEPALRYCVSIYCQQGWDPRTTQIEVTRMPDDDSDRALKCGAHSGQERSR